MSAALAASMRQPEPFYREAGVAYQAANTRKPH